MPCTDSFEDRPPTTKVVRVPDVPGSARVPVPGGLVTQVLGTQTSHNWIAAALQNAGIASAPRERSDPGNWLGPCEQAEHPEEEQSDPWKGLA